MTHLQKRICHMAVLALSVTSLWGWQQQSENNARGDSTLIDSVSAELVVWTERLVITPQDLWGADLLRHPWDVWGHSDVVATALNPLVLADARVGAAFLDGSTGAPVLSMAIPAVTRAVHSFDESSGRWGALEAVHFEVNPMDDEERATQTLFYWDQGDYAFRDVQVGSVINLSPGRNLLVAAQGMAHPGPYGNSVPGSVASTSFLLQNYLIDYRSTVSERTDIGYTLLHQQEGTGLPYWIGTDTVSIGRDIRRSDTWSHGISVRWDGELHTAEVYGSVSTASMVTAPAGEQSNYLDRRLLNTWLGGKLAYSINEKSSLNLTISTRSRAIQDHTLGFNYSSANLASLAARWASDGLALSGGLGVTSLGVYPELNAVFTGRLGRLRLSHQGVPYLDFPHLSRAVTGDTTEWNDQPGRVKRTLLAYTFERRQLQLEFNAAHFLSRSGASVVSTGGYIQWAPWPQVMKINAAVLAVQSGLESPLSAWVNASGGITLTLPLKRSRAKPFVSLAGVLVGHDFTWWLDPRYGDLALLDPPAEDPTSMTLWGTAEMGIKVRQFELRFGRINFTSQRVQNSRRYMELSPMTHYSLSWQFIPPAN